MIYSVAPTRSSTFYAYLITKIGNRNLTSLIRSISGQGREVLQFLQTWKRSSRIPLILFVPGSCPPVPLQDQS